jgi:tRNA modification GTPase
VSLLTPPGQGALATLGLCGPLAWPAVRSLFRPRRGELPKTPPTQAAFWLGQLGEADGARDEVVLRAGGEGKCARVEIHCHGGREVVRMLLDLFAARGLRVCPWPGFLRHTGDDALSAAATAALAEAPTLRTADILLQQAHGALWAALLDACGRLERGDAAGARGVVAGLARWAPLGRRLTRPWRVVVAGAPNVGKSSLVNALAGYGRSVVSEVPGTTRDVVTARIAVDGWPVELADTAGLRAGGGDLEARGMALARERAASADLVLWLLDGSAPPAYPEPGPANVRLVVNKADLPAAWDDAGALPRVSATTGRGVAELASALAGWLVPEAPPAGAAVPFTPELCDAVEEAWRHLQADRGEDALRVLRRLQGSGE